MEEMQDKKVLVFVGMPGSGKSVCVEFLRNKGFPFVYFGGITIDEVKHRGMELNEASEKLVREDIRAKEGKGAYGVRIIKKIEEYLEKGEGCVVVDGLYSWTEYKIFKDSFGDNAIIIALITPRRMRHDRLAKRPVRPLTIKESEERDHAEIENLEKGGPIANADYFLPNEDDVKSLENDLVKLLNRLDIKAT
jgi:dephospho-CoA kinase